MSDSIEGQPSETQLVPKLSQITTQPNSDVAAAALDQAGEAMAQVLNAALIGFNQQNVPVCDQALSQARAIYDRTKKLIDGPELFVIGSLKSLVSLYASLARTGKFLAEGRFRKGKEEAAKGRACCTEGTELLEKLFKQSTDARGDSGLQAMQIMFLALEKLISGLEIQTRAEEFGFRGQIPEYLELLKGMVVELRAGAELTGASDEPNVAAFRRVLTEMADRTETRTEFFELGGGGAEDYLTPKGKKIFIIHGSDEAKWRELMQLLEKKFKVEVIELSEKVNECRTIITKFEAFANECCYAFALLTPDDFVKTGDSEQEPGYLQARPNVLFELGWFYGRFGPKRISIIKKAGTQIPSDLTGMVYIEFNNQISEAFMKIQEELHNAGAIPEA